MTDILVLKKGVVGLISYRLRYKLFVMANYLPTRFPTRLFFELPILTISEVNTVVTDEISPHQTT